MQMTILFFIGRVTNYGKKMKPNETKTPKWSIEELLLVFFILIFVPTFSKEKKIDLGPYMSN
jgi:hypothetical protein